MLKILIYNFTFDLPKKGKGKLNKTFWRKGSFLSNINTAFIKEGVFLKLVLEIFQLIATKENGGQIKIVYNRLSTHCTLKLRQSHLFQRFCKINLLRAPNGSTQFKYTPSTAYMHS